MARDDSPMRVHILSPVTTKAYNVLYPLRAFRRGIRRTGIAVRIFSRPSALLTSCDVLCLTSEYWKGSRRQQADRPLLESVRRYREAVKTLVWLDTSDSSGTTAFEVLPFVDCYAKGQLLRDRGRYTQPFYGLRYHTDFYHQHNGITDTTESHRVAADPRYLHKLMVSWNLGLGNYVGQNRERALRLGRLRFYWPVAAYNWTRTSASDDHRSIDISFRGLLDYGRETVSFQRRETLRRLIEYATLTGRNVAHTGRIPYREFRDEMRRSKLVISPFGFGEINAGRDFECFADGATLVKPDLSHLETWPDYFELGTTYAGYQWNFADFESTLDRLLSRPSERVQIAQSGQARYLESLSPQGEAAFARHFDSLLQRATGSERKAAAVCI
jgi:hypothetical protein